MTEKGPALLKNGDIAEKLTKEQAELIKGRLVLQQHRHEGK
ncbi:hypothetical protein [Bradyrhizobium sp. USDA 4452]